MDNKIREYIDELLKQALKEGFSEAEVYYGSDNSMSVSAREGKIIEFENSDSSGISFRGLFNGQMGSADTEDIQPDMIPFLINQAKDNCRVLEVKEEITVFEGEKEYPEFNGYSEDLAKIDYQTLADAALSMEKELLGYDSRIEAVDDSNAIYSSTISYLQNTKGMICESQTNDFAVYLGCRAKDGEDVQTYGKSWSYGERSEFDAKKCAEYVGEHVIAKLGAAPVDSLKTPIVLDRFAAKSILAAFSGAFNAEAIQKGLSRLVGKIGERIANEKITLIDEGMIEGSRLCCPFDSEGVITKKTVLIDKGIFRSALHNRKTALADGVESTGNASRGGKNGLGISPANFHFETGDLTLEELFKKMENGIYITAVYGLHAGINGISGDFSLMSEGFVIRDGKIAEPVNQITIADNFFDVLMKVEELADDVEYFSPEASHIQSPSLLIPDVSVAGK
ncbi:MAG TPA: TldD/PmbA family protein [Clostridiales bacterium]|nr:TldD/PmbA family protein [Clostridiales bacterium]